MDPKGAAKSKRSQSLQGKRNHPTPSAASAHKKKEPQTQSKQPQQGGPPRSRRHHRDLPSNWDRYDNEEDDIVEADEGGSGPVRKDGGGLGVKSVQKPVVGGGDTTAPKSKGADFGYLIEQARSQAHGSAYGDGGLASASVDDDTVPDLVQGLMSIISMKGESLLSLCNDDNFKVDNDAGSSFEVPFLSMDVHDLAAQLSKLNMAQRLFIEEDILPAELMQGADTQNNNIVRGFHHVETEQSSESRHCLSEDALPGAENPQVASGQSKFGPSVAAEAHGSLKKSEKSVSQPFSKGQGIKQEVINSVESLEWESKRPIKESGSSADVNAIQDSSLKFEVAAAEAELDLLLDSFGVMNDFTSHGSGSGMSARNDGPNLAQWDAVSSRKESSTLGKAGPGIPLEDTSDDILAKIDASSSPGMRDFGNSSGTLLKPCDLSMGMDAGSSGLGFSDSRHIVPLEKSIDDLLAETSLFDSSGGADPSDGGLAQGRPHGCSVRVDNAPYSTHAASTMFLDETLDDLLAETSSDLKNKEPSHPQGKSHVSYGKPNASKALDDLDTWLDSI